MEQQERDPERGQPVRPAPDGPATRRKPYTRPAIVGETRLETRAGSPVSIPIDPMNVRNDYGL